MKITIESPHIRVSAETIQAIETKLLHLMKKYDRTVICEVVLRKEKNDEQKNFHLEAKLQVPKGVLFAEEKAENFETALDKLIEDIKRQLQKHKERFEEIRKAS